MLETTMATGTPMAIFENVLGLSKYMQAVQKGMIRALPGYKIFLTKMCPTELGFAARRGRFFFLAVRSDLCLTDDAKKLGDLVARIMAKVKKPVPKNLRDYLLPANHKWVLAQQARQKKHAGHGTCGLPRSLQGVVPSLTSRQVKALAHAWHGKCAARGGTLSFVADVSQSTGRAPVGFSGEVPCVTPGGRLVAAELGRLLVPEEKLMMANFPVHSISIPKDLSPCQVADLAGNTMHTACIGLAMLCTMAMLKLEKLNSPAPSTTGHGEWMDLSGMKHGKAVKTKAARGRKALCGKGKAMKAMKAETHGRKRMQGKFNRRMGTVTVDSQRPSKSRKVQQNQKPVSGRAAYAAAYYN